MAQLNPNFEIDFSDINSYEQIQLINDTQMAKENLLMHRAYKEPSDDEIIRNQFSSFTFVDFCPKLYRIKPPPPSTVSAPTGGSQHSHHQQQDSTASAHLGREQTANGLSLKCYELETFSDLFDRINTWLKLNKDWRVVSMQTLVFDCTTQFNHQKSSIYSSYLPQNTRGLRLFLSPSKSRFSGPQKIGCINVVPRKVSGSYLKPEEPPTYETLDEILDRLNELLLTRPIEGRILSVETLTLPMVNGYVNTESNYFIDSRLNSLHESTYTLSGDCGCPTATKNDHNQPPGPEAQLSSASVQVRERCLIDILRVYYEFGPLVCGLVNLIDFVPKFYTSKQQQQPPAAAAAAADTQAGGTAAIESNPSSQQQQEQDCAENLMPKPVPKIAATESLTRLIRRSLAQFESQRKRILNDGFSSDSTKDQLQSPIGGRNNKQVNLKVCSLQVHHKTLLKGQLLQVSGTNVREMVDTRMMMHERVDYKEPLACGQCSLLSCSTEPQNWCSHLVELAQPYNLKFIRLAYIVPVSNNCLLGQQSGQRIQRPLATNRKPPAVTKSEEDLEEGPAEVEGAATSGGGGGNTPGQLIPELSSSSTTDSSEPATPDPELHEPGQSSSGNEEIQTASKEQQQKQRRTRAELLEVVEEDAKQVALIILDDTNQRHLAAEQDYHTQDMDDGLNDSPIGQLTYRLFAPCQLVNSSSCFSINPVNSSSPLARRGSLVTNGSGGISSENAHPSAASLLLNPGSSNSLSSSGNEPQQVVTSFGAFFPALSHDAIATAAAGNLIQQQQQQDTCNVPLGSRLVGAGGGASGGGGNGSRFTTNEFEPVDAIKRRMEIYVTTNSMKVIAGETLIVHLSDALACLSTAIEQTVVRANFGPLSKRRTPNTWVSVYVLYAAVEEPQLPAQLLAQQRMRELSLIDEGALGQEEEEQVEETKGGRDIFRRKRSPLDDNNYRQLPPLAAATTATATTAEPGSNSIRVERDPINSSLTLYNTAYDRTVALPAPPENHSSNSVDMVDYLGSDGLWIDQDPFSDRVLHMPDMAARKKRRKKAKKSRHDDSQCSIM